MPRSSSETHQVSGCHSSLVTTTSSRMILDKPKIEITKDPIFHAGKNEEHFYGENFIYEYPTKRHLKSNQHMDILHAVSNCPTKRHIKSNQHMCILHAFSNCVRATFNHVLSPSEVDWGDPQGEPTKHGLSLMEVDWGRKMLNYTSSGSMVMEVDWGGNLLINSCKRKTNHNYTSSGPMLMEVEWGGKLRAISVVDWGAHETHPNGHSITEVDWGGHDASPYNMNGPLCPLKLIGEVIMLFPTI